MPNFVDLTIAADALSKAKRVMVIGSSGAGKSTLSASIAKTFDMRHIPLDRDMRWLPGWQVRDRDEQRALHDGFCDLDRWVIDGTSISLFPKTFGPRRFVCLAPPQPGLSVVGCGKACCQKLRKSPRRYG